MSSTSILLNDVKNKLNASVGITLIVFGTVGNVLNIILFRQRALWTLSPSIPFLLTAAIANIVSIYSIVILRTLIGFNFTPTYFSSPVCKLQVYMLYTPYCLSSWYMVGCCADRFLSSSRNASVRRYSSMRTTGRIMLVVTIIIISAYSQVLYCYEANQFTKPAPCYMRNTVCNVVDIVYYFVFQSTGPPVLMLIFGIGTFIHIRQGRHAQQPPSHIVSENASATVRVGQTKTKSNDRSILPLLFTQVTVYVICSIPLFASKVYSVVPQPIFKSDVRLAAENLILNISIWLSLVDKIFSFYIYTLTSKHFRHEFIKFITKCRRQHRIAPEN